jgi:YbgC/YbaW family acyl-CoA thioester hydrolase
MAAPRVSEFRLRRRVNFYEVDQARIVHFSWYFRYFEEAEHALWRSAGLSIAKPGDTVGFPRVAASFEYHKPLQFEDEFDIVVQITKISDRSIGYRCTLTNGEQRIATGAITIVCVTKQPDGTMAAAAIPGAIAERFEVASGISA